MSKHVNLTKALQALEGVPADALCPITIRMPASTLRKVYSVCLRERVLTAELLRQVLDTHIDAYVGDQRAAFKPPLPHRVLVGLSTEVSHLVDKVCANLHVDASTLLQLMVTDALPAWIDRAVAAEQKLQTARASLGEA